MRKTLTIADDVLSIVRAMAQQSGTSLREALSNLARHGPRGTEAATEDQDSRLRGSRTGPASGDVYNAIGRMVVPL